MAEDLRAMRKDLETLRSRDLGDVADRLEEMLERWEHERSEILHRLDRLTTNQREMDARLWPLEDSRVFRLLQRCGIALHSMKTHVGRLVNPSAEARRKQLAYRLWLESQPPREMNKGALSYQPRFKVLTVGDESAESLNQSAREGDSDYLVLMSPHSRLAPNALSCLAMELQGDRFEVLYGDEDRLSASGARQDPIFKPQWSPDLVFSPLYLGRFFVVSTIVFQAAGGFREGLEGAYLFDLALRLAEQPVRFQHVPQILVSESVGGGVEGTRLALEHCAARRDLVARIIPSGTGFTIRRKVEGTPLVSIVICSRSARLLKRCLNGIERATAYSNREIVVVEHVVEEKGEMDHFLCGSSCTRVRYVGRFDFAAMSNLGARSARGEVILLLNDDVEPLNKEWLEAMIAQVQRPEVGVVGALLLYPSGEIQHSGIAIGLMGTAGHPGRGTRDGGFWPWTAVTRNVSAVTGACIAIRRDVFEQLDGLDRRFPVNYNDVDLCLRARRAGYEVILEASARLQHLESGTRPRGVAWEERELFAERWGAEIAGVDPYYTPRLTLHREDCSLKGT